MLGSSGTSPKRLLKSAAFLFAMAVFTAGVLSAGGPPGYEPAYFNGGTYWINAIEVPQNPTGHAQADLYVVVYPFNPATGAELPGYGTPQCNPCDHEGNGVDPGDFHDHVLDSIPSKPGKGEFSPLWHVFAIVPNYTGDAAHDAAVNAAYHTVLPLKSETAIDAFLALKDANGVPFAIEIDTHFYFLCAVLNPNAGGH